MATCAVDHIKRHRISQIDRLEVTGVTVRRAGVTSSSIMVSRVSRVAVSAVYDWNLWANYWLHEGVFARPAVLRTQLAHAQGIKLGIDVDCWNFDRDQGSDVVAGSAVGERSQGEGAGVPLAIRARIGGC